MRKCSNNALDNEAKSLVKEIKQELRRPTPLPPSKAPTGKGTTKNDLLVQRLAMEFEFDPIAQLVELARNKYSSPDLKAKINMELLQYYLPKLKAIDTNPNQGETISINIIQPEGSVIEAQVVKNKEFSEE